MSNEKETKRKVVISPIRSLKIDEEGIVSSLFFLNI